MDVARCVANVRALHGHVVTDEAATHQMHAEFAGSGVAPRDLSPLHLLTMHGVVDVLWDSRPSAAGTQERRHVAVTPS